MRVLIFLLLFIIVLPLWAWLVSRLWKSCSPATRASFFLIVPAYVYAFRQWDDREIAPRPALSASLFALAIFLLIGYKAFDDEIRSLFFGRDYADEKLRIKPPARTAAEWTRWCRDDNDATYDPALGTCVENGREEAVARSQSRDIFGRLRRHLDKHGIQGEFDDSRSAAALQSGLLSPEIARAYAYYFLPLSMSQAPTAFLLCVSEAACITYEQHARERGAPNVTRNANLLLVLPQESSADARSIALAQAFSRFKSR